MKIIKSILVATLALVPMSGYGSVILSEVMYDLEGSDTNEWIEVQNVSTEDIDISGWKLFENNVNHTLKIFNGDIVLQPNEYAIIANDANAFLNAYPNVQFPVFDSVFSLSNTGEQLVLRNELNVDKDSFTYSNTLGANGDGNSLQNINGTWGVGQPTPGFQNSWSQVAGTSTEDVDDNASNKNENPPVENKTQQKLLSIYTSPVREFDFLEPKFVVSAGPDRLTAVGNSVEFRADTNEENLNEGKGATFLWSFGDGSMKYGSSVTYSYRVPGEYVVVVNAEKGQYESADQILVKVIEPKISLKQDNEGNAVVVNNSDDDINMYQWKISYLGKEFVFPKDTIIRKGKTITLHKDITHFSLQQGIAPILLDPRGLLYVYEKPPVPVKIGSAIQNRVVKATQENQEVPIVEPLVDIGDGEVLGQKKSIWFSLKEVFIKLID